MAAGAGRNMTILEGGVRIAGLRTKSFTIDNTPIDITTDDDSGIRALLLNAAGTAIEPSTRSINATFDGVTQDDGLTKAIVKNEGTVRDFDLLLSSGALISGKFALVNMALTGETADAQTFSGELQSTGEWSWTDAP